MRGEGQGGAVEESHAGGVSQFLEHAVELVDVELADVFLGQQRGEVTQERGSNPVSGSDAPAILLKRDDARLTGEHFDRDPQDTRQQLLKIKFLSQRAGYFEQVIALPDAKVWKHSGIERYFITAK